MDLILNQSDAEMVRQRQLARELEFLMYEIDRIFEGSHSSDAKVNDWAKYRAALVDSCTQYDEAHIRPRDPPPITGWTPQPFRLADDLLVSEEDLRTPEARAEGLHIPRTLRFLLSDFALPTQPTPKKELCVVRARHNGCLSVAVRLA